MRVDERSARSRSCSTRDHHHYDAHDLETAQDLADRAAVAIDNALLHAELQNGLREREELMRIVSHDLRTPLGYIATSSSTAAREHCPPDQTRAAQWADGIARSASQMQRLISDLLDMAKLDSGTLKLARGAMRLARCGRRNVRAARVSSQAEAASRSSMMSPKQLMIDADRDRMCAGHLQPRRQRDQVHTRRRPRQRRSEPADWATHISVVDTGIGMAPEELSHVFEPYWQGSHRDMQGVGLGLSIVARLDQVRMAVRST